MSNLVRKPVRGAGSGGGGGSSEWGQITGTLADQTDLQAALNAKMPTGVAGTEIVDTQSWYTQTAFAANVYTITSSSGTNPTSLAAGSRGSFIALNPNAGTSPVQITIGANTYTLKASYGDLVANDIVANSLVSWISDGTELKVIKKNNALDHSKRAIRVMNNVGDYLSFLNAFPYGGFISAANFIVNDNGQDNDKQLFFLANAVTTITLPLTTTLANNFSFRFYNSNAGADRIRTIVPDPLDSVSLNGVGSPAGTSVSLTVAQGSNECYEIIKAQNGTWFVTGIQKASTAISGVSKIAASSDYTNLADDKIATPAGINTYYAPIGTLNSSYQRTPKGLLKTVRHTIASLVAGGQSAVIPLVFNSTVPFGDAAKLIVESPSITDGSGAMLAYSMTTPTITGFDLTIFNNGTSAATNIIFTVNVYESIL